MADLALDKVEVAFEGFRYPYFFGYDCINQIIESISTYEVDRFLVVTDETVLNLHGSTFLQGLRTVAPTTVICLRPGESAKSLTSLSDSLEKAIEAGATRRSLVITFGGGVPGNLGGLLASLLFRGIRLIHVPTTTMAAMDSVISLKQAINSNHGKNLIGSYWKPEAVYTDVQLLQTLPHRELRSGLCEATKNCLAIRPDTAPQILNVLSRGELAGEETLLWLLRESLLAKSSVMTQDAKEQGAGIVLEYGHTVGHAVEIRDQRHRRAAGLSHGDSVALGMLAAARVSKSLGGLDQAAVDLHFHLVDTLGAPTKIPRGISVEEIMRVLLTDNKRGYLPLKDDEGALVVLRDLGTPYLTGEVPLVSVPFSLVRTAVSSLSSESIRVSN